MKELTQWILSEQKTSEANGSQPLQARPDERKLEQRLDPLSSALKIDGSVKTGTINGSNSQFRFRAIDPMPLNPCFNS
ncbi:hypothetical protein SynMVIR181_01854 [Synechococcus sp. MVIR-18-1]|nr:hypothetical protein SynMVIR181_01854 [Synechococcus sp. MVIR-18-1]